jgi:hypothetical protein
MVKFGPWQRGHVFNKRQQTTKSDVQINRKSPSSQPRLRQSLDFSRQIVTIEVKLHRNKMSTVDVRMFQVSLHKQQDV